MHSSNGPSAVDRQKTPEKDAEPVIARFRQALMSIQSAELNRLYNRLPGLDERSRQAIGQFADCLVATMLHPPLESLRSETSRNDSHVLVNALERLFQLDDGHPGLVMPAAPGSAGG